MIEKSNLIIVFHNKLNFISVDEKSLFFLVRCTLSCVTGGADEL